MLLSTARSKVCRAGRRVVQEGLVTGSAGNISVRAGDKVVVTPGGAQLHRLAEAACPIVGLDGRVLRGPKEPSSETPMHLAIYRETDAGAIVHTHSADCVAVSTVLDELPPIHYYTLMLGGVVRVAEYATYGTPELARNVLAALRGGRRAALMANHGAVALGRDLDEAVENALLLEWLCGVYLKARAVGTPRALTDVQLGDAAERFAGPGYVPPA
ncbi:class II aldolase/adducin family protein [Actinomadura logoneensis]|uniref:Class II aldolase/adducin family protein n=1 Tax=Actinomadura logoneensis TaxID=2293572 RepID=A0A372JLC3_9ACTN|nr:class II aldolase/adducin family protein [Actinomadura logoneensis]RFU40740.1 class II aldolase/adducin family protein [Actinomadura logoneensis]